MNVDLWVSFIGGEGLALPVITAKLLRKRIVIASAGSGVKVAQAQSDPLSIIATFLQSITHRLSDRIIVYSERPIEEHGLQKYRTKISIAHKHFLDFGRFKVKKQFAERGNIIGYIGALSKAKGVPNLPETISKVLSSENKGEFLIGGDGELRGEVEEFSNRENLNRKVKYLGWIAHDELPKYLNELKLLVLPSYTEGLPNIMLEAMACGTPVLATPVGAIPDIIKDGEIGFIMEDNSPGCIAGNIVRALAYPDLEQIARNAHNLVKKELTFEKAGGNYRNILIDMR
jgi:glycosyltransferase involved in cell wall biosynthesis